MKKSMVLGIIVVIAILGIAIYFFNQQKEAPKTLSFGEGLNEVNSLWGKNQINRLDLLDKEKISLLSDQKLEALYRDLEKYKENLNQFQQTEDVKALNSFVEIQLSLVEELKTAKELKEDVLKLEETVTTDEEVCANLSKIKSLGDKTVELNDKILSVNEKINSFTENYSEQAKKSLIVDFLANETGLKGTKESNESILSELKEACQA